MFDRILNTPPKMVLSEMYIAINLFELDPSITSQNGQIHFKNLRICLNLIYKCKTSQNTSVTETFVQKLIFIVKICSHMKWIIIASKGKSPTAKKDICHQELTL